MVWLACAAGAARGQARIVFEYPLDGTAFPPELPAPGFRWKDEDSRADLWLVTIEFADGRGRLNYFAREAQWRPDTPVWEDIRNRSREAPAIVTIVGLNHLRPARALSTGHITIGTSSDPVGAPLFYREVNLPFVDAVKDPSTIRWRFGAVSSVETPPVVLEKLPVCGNCHSFSANAAVLGMDIDYANDKGSYAITRLQEEIVLQGRRRRFVQKAHAAAAAGAAPAALRIQAQAGRLHRVQERRAHRRFDL